MQSHLLASNPVFGAYEKGIYIFTLPIQYYAIVIVCGMLIASLLSVLLMKRRNIDTGIIYILFIACIPSAIVGARLFSCLTAGSIGSYSFGAWFVRFIKPPWQGLSITGGVIGGVLAGFIVCRCCKVDFLRVADCVVVNILFAQALGRWGNYFNQEVYGGLVTDPSQQWFPWAVFIDDVGEWHYAFFFYEMVFNLIGWALLFTFTWYRKKKPNGISTCLYFVWYGTVRACMEPLRDTEFILNAGGVMWSELFAILLAGLGVICILALLLVNYKREGAFVGSRRGDPYGISNYLSPNKKAKPYYSKINMFGANYPPKPEKKKKNKGQLPDAEEESEGEEPRMPRPAPLSSRKASPQEEPREGAGKENDQE